jgi:hypothetical protein
MASINGSNGAGAPKTNSAQPQAEATRTDTVALAAVMVAVQPVATNLGAGQAKAVIEDRRAFTAITARPIITSPIATEIARPAWTIAALPYIALEPAPVQNDPLRIGDFLLWPDTTNYRAFFALAVPHLLSLSVTIQSTVQPDRSVRITGGTASLAVGVYAQEDAQVLVRNRQAWTNELVKRFGSPQDDTIDPGVDDWELPPSSRPGTIVKPRPILRPIVRRLLWQFQPQNLRALSGVIDLPSAYVKGTPQMTANTSAGAVTFIVELSETGALAWKSALEQRNPALVPGACRLTASYYGQNNAGVVVRDQQLTSDLSALLAGTGPDNLHVIYPQQEVDALLYVAGHELVQNVSVTMASNVGDAPATQVFGRDGGELKLAVTTQDPEHVRVNWTAQVTFNSTGWPPIPTSGHMSLSDGLSDILKPDSWIVPYTILAVLVDVNGNAVHIANAGANYHVNGVLTFTAPYIPAGILVASFDAANQSPVNVALPRYPNQPFGDLVLNMFATRDGKASTKSRKLSPTELIVCVKIHPDASIEIVTSQDTLPEDSFEAGVMGILAQLR